MFYGPIVRITACLLVCLFPVLTWAGTRALHSFHDLMQALKSGEKVRVVTHYGECRLVMDGKDEEAPDAVGGMDIDAWEYFAPGSIGNAEAFVVFSHNTLIHHYKRGYVFNYVKFRITEDDSVAVTARYLTPVVLETAMDETFFTVIHAPGRSGGVHLFMQD